jgi:hypothetical protein
MNAGGGFTGSGILGEYYANVTNPTNWLNNMSKYTPAFSRTDVRIDFTSSNNAPGGVSQDSYDSAVASTNFAVKWTGSFIPAFSETYTFKTITNDGVVLKINGYTVINNFTSESLTTNTYTFAVTAGRTYTIEMDYFHGSSSTWDAQLHWFSTNVKPSSAGYFAEEAIEPASPVGVNYEVDPKEFANAVVFASYVNASALTTNPADGWPTEDFQLSLFSRGEFGLNDQGTYLLQFTGEAQVTATFGATVDFKVGGKDYGATLPFGAGFNGTTTTATFTMPDISAYGALNLGFTKTQRDGGGGGVTNIDVMRPTTLGGTTDYPVGTLFTNAGLATAAPYTALRMMGWTDTSTNSGASWSTRALPGANFWDTTGDGMAWETAIALANASGKDLYVNIPVDASDAFLTDLADLLKYGSDGVNPYTSPQAHPVWAPLDSNLNIYIEYANELWNFGNVIYSNVAATVLQNVQNNTPDGQLFTAAGGWVNTNTNGVATASDTAVWAVVIDVDISNIFRQVFGNAAMPANAAGVVNPDPRIRSVFEWQAGGNFNGGSTSANNAMSTVDALLPHAIGYYIWGGGGAWYSDNAEGGFSDVQFTNPNFDSGTTGWTFSSGAGVVANGSALGNPNAPTQVAPSSAAKTTTNAVYLKPGASISQSVYFSGGYADITLYATQSAANNYRGLQISIDGTVIPESEGATAYSGTQDSWTWARTGAFYTGASPGWHTITFTSTQSAASGVVVFLDNLGIQTVNGIFKEEAASGQASISLVESDVTICLEFGLHDVGYEGGFDFNQNMSSGGYSGMSKAGYSTLVPNVGMYANLDARTEQLAINTIDQFFEDGGALPIDFQSTGNVNSWGIMTPTLYNAVGAATSLPKVEAVTKVGKSLPPAVNYTLAPGSFAAPANDWQAAGSTLSETFLITSSTHYNVGVTIANTGNGATGTFQILVNGSNKVNGAVIPPINVTDGSTIPFTISQYLSYGVNTISVVCVSVKKSRSFGLELTSLVVDPQT